MKTIFLTYIKEIFKKKIIQLIFVLNIVYFILFYLVGYFGLKDTDISQVKHFTDMIMSTLGFYFSTMNITFFTILLSSGILTNDIESGTIHSIISQPLKRVSYILGKYFSMILISSIYTIFVYIMIIFNSKVLGTDTFENVSSINLILGGLVYLFIPISVISLCIFGNSYFKSISNGIFIFVLYMFGVIGGLLEQIASVTGKFNLVNIGILSSLLSPANIIYRIVVESILGEANISSGLFVGLNLTCSKPSTIMYIYIALYIVILPIVAIIRFNKLDLN
jgi:ABC-type transport system involved in multi-copper enzyme maturation permease subunit